MRFHPWDTSIFPNADAIRCQSVAMRLLLLSSHHHLPPLSRPESPALARADTGRNPTQTLPIFVAFRVESAVNPPSPPFLQVTAGFLAFYASPSAVDSLELSPILWQQRNISILG
jgi:hypothetical protein